MVFSYLTEDNLGEKYDNAVSYTDSLTKPYPEFERIAGNKPSEQRDPRYSDVTDGTTASVIRKLGKRIVQQLPTGKIETDDDNDWLPIVAEFIYTHKILPYANLDYDLLQKCWQAIERGATYGAQFIYTPFINHDGEFTTDMSLPYWSDVKIPRGSKSGSSHNYVFLRTWWQEEDFDALIDREAKLSKQAKRRGEVYESTWDMKAIRKAKKRLTTKQSDDQDPSERDRNTNPDGVEVVTGLQIGVGATFYTFVPGEDETSKDSGVTTIRRKKNKDPRGKIPGDWYYNDTDGFNPLGRGLVELIGALQNLIDSDMQMYQWNRALMLNPPLMKRGSFGKRKIVWAPGQIIDVGSDANAEVKALDVDTSAVVNYPDLYGLQKSQLLNLVNSPDTSISSDVGNPGFGKTPQALNMQQATISVDDNYVRKNFEAMWENWSETSVNVYFAERTGKEVLQLDKSTATKLRKLADEGKFDLANLNNDNELIIDYDTATPVLRFRVDASTSKMKEDVAQADILKELLSTYENSPILTQVIPPEKVIAVWNRIVSNSSVEDPEDLSVDIEEFKKEQEAQAIQAQQQAAVQPGQLPGAPQTPIEGEVVPPNEDDQIIQHLTQMGVDEDIIQMVVPLLDSPTVTGDDILAAVNAEMGARYAGR